MFIRNYPKEIKAFYMKLNPDGRTVAATDLIVPGVRWPPAELLILLLCPWDSLTVRFLCFLRASAMFVRIRVLVLRWGGVLCLSAADWRADRWFAKGGQP